MTSWWATRPGRRTEWIGHVALHQLGRARRGARGLVELAVVVQLDDLGLAPCAWRPRLRTASSARRRWRSSGRRRRWRAGRVRGPRRAPRRRSRWSRSRRARRPRPPRARCPAPESGCVKSTSTSASPSTSATVVPSAGSARPVSSCRRRPRRRRRRSAPSGPAAPATATRIRARTRGPRAERLERGIEHRPRRRRCPLRSGAPGANSSCASSSRSADGHGVDALDHLVDAQQRQAGEHARARAGSSARSSTPAPARAGP